MSSGEVSDGLKTGVGGWTDLLSSITGDVLEGCDPPTIFPTFDPPQRNSTRKTVLLK